MLKAALNVQLYCPQSMSDDDAHCDDGDDLFADDEVIAYDWTTMHGTCFEEHSRMAVDVEQILQADGTSFISLENCSEAAPRYAIDQNQESRLLPAGRSVTDHE